LLNRWIEEKLQQVLTEESIGVLRDGKVTSALIGASKVSQIEDNIEVLDNLKFTKEELNKIEESLV
jgi:L-glyceraldehyde 3-phosphate reductase